SVSDDEFPHESLSLNSESSSNLLSLFSSRSKKQNGCFLNTMDVSQFPGRKNGKNAGRAQDKALGTKCM
ncbi:unnamed protein product, partial [Staurois parvus]